MFRLNQITIILILLTVAVYLIHPVAVHASGLILETDTQMEGLTFDSPLPLDQENNITKLFNIDLNFKPPSLLNITPSTATNAAKLTQLLQKPPQNFSTLELHASFSPSPTPFAHPILIKLAKPSPSALIDCIGPDGKHAQMDPQTCQSFNAAWSHPSTGILSHLVNPQLTSWGLSANVLFAMINNHRLNIGLPAFKKDSRSCNLAASRAPEVAHEVATGTMHLGLKERNLPYWNTENIIDIHSNQAAFDWWMNDYIHKKAIESHNVYSCIACSGYACAEEFTSYIPK